MTYGILFNLIALVSISALLASVMVHAEDPATSPPEDPHQHHTRPAPTHDASAHPHHSHTGHEAHGSAGHSESDTKSSGWAEHLQLEGAKATALAAAEKKYHERRRALKKKHYAEMMALEKDKLESLETVLSKEELAKLQAMWIKQLRDEHQQH